MDFKCDELILGKKDADSRALTEKHTIEQCRGILKPHTVDHATHSLHAALVVVGPLSNKALDIVTVE